MSEAQDARRALDRAEDAAVAGDFVSADQLLRSALRIQEGELGPSHPDLATTLTNLGIVAEKTGRPEDAETFYRRAAAIASASFPPDHAVVVESRKNLEDFCRERGLPIAATVVTAPVVTTPLPPVSDQAAPSSLPLPHSTTTPPPQPSPLPAQRAAPRSFAWAAIGGAILVITVFAVWRGSSPLDTATNPTTEPSAQRAVEPAPQSPVPPAPIEQVQPPKVVSRENSRGVTTGKPQATRSTPAVSLTTVQLCRTLSTSGATWRCDPVGDTVSPRQLTLYTRVKSPRDGVIVHRWYRGQDLKQSATLQIRANSTEGYRTFSRLTLDGSGDWRVEVRSAEGDMLFEQRFAVR